MVRPETNAESATRNGNVNTFGQLFRVTTFGESHGPAIGCVIDGCPPGLEIAPEEFAHDLQRRATGKSRHTSARREADEVEILSGVYEGRTTGTPIALLIRNTDQRSKDYSNIAQQFRPGHADYSYWQKYGIRDPRGGGRSSARETTMRVAAGVIAKKWLQQRYGVTVRGYLSQLGEVIPAGFDWSAVEENPFFWPDANQVPALETYMDALRKSGDSVGARVNVVADGVPPGWGEPIYGKLDGDIAAALMSINAVKGVEIGDGFASAAQKGTEHRDLITPEGFQSNHAGGILGGISTGPLAGNARSGTTPLCWVLEPLTRKNWAMVSFTWPKRSFSLAGQRSSGTTFCTVPLPKVVSPITRPRP